MKPSKYQEAVYDHFEARQKNGAVVSVAGSGKTYTAIESLSRVPPLYNVLLAAFNKDIRIDFQAKIQAKGLRHVTPSTFNAFGWGICTKNCRGVVLDENKTQRTLEFVTWNPQTDAERKRMWSHMRTIERLVSLFKSRGFMTADEADANLDEIYEYHGITEPPPRDILLHTFSRSANNTKIMDYDDQKYMPIKFGWAIPRFDTVVIDEFQDTCEIELRLMRAAAEGGIMYAFGDPDQTIYSFKGVTPDNFERFKVDMQADELPLSICYRCPKSVVREAQKVVPRIEPWDEAPEGSVDWESTEDFLRSVREGDFVLCRTTAPLIRRNIQLLEMGKQAKVRGRDIGDKLQILIDVVSKWEKRMPIKEFVTRLLEYKTEQSEKLAAIRNEAGISSLHDRVDSTVALAKDCYEVYDLERRIREVFCDDKAKHGGVDMMTGHKSKGLQAPRVHILRPDLLPHPMAKKPWMQEEEERLRYVMVTRSQDQLRYVRKEENER